MGRNSKSSKGNLSGKRAKILKEEDSNSDVDVDSSSSEQEDLELTGNSASQEIINIEIEFFDPIESDYWGVRQLIQSSGLEGMEPFKADLSGLADAISKQGAVGTTIKSEADVEEEEEAAGKKLKEDYEIRNLLGFLTVLSFEQFREAPFMKSIISGLFAKCQDPDQKKFLDSVVNAPGSGLMISRRMINTPLDVIPQLHKALLEDIQWAEKNAEELDLRRVFGFKKFLLLSRYQNEERSHPQKNSKKRAKKEKVQVFKHFEEEFYASRSDFELEFKLSHRDNEICKVLVFDRGVLEQAFEGMTNLFSDSVLGME